MLNFIRLCSERLVRNFYPYNRARTILAGPARGLKFMVEPGMGLTFAIGKIDTGMKFLQQHVQPGMTIFDIGANRGQAALIFSRLTGSDGLVVSFEPVPALYQSMLHNIEMNNLQNIRPESVAIADQDGHADFMFSSQLSTQGKLAGVEKSYEYSGAEIIQVSTMTLDSFIVTTGLVPDLIKIDTEGAGAAVLRGAARLLENQSPNVYIELHGPEEQAGVRQELQQRGYEIENLQGVTIKDPTQGWHSPLWCYRPT